MTENTRLRLLWVFSTFALGGPQRRMATLVGELGSAYEHDVLAMDGRYGAEAVLPDLSRYRRVEASVEKGGLISLANLRAFRRIVAERQPDLLLTSNWGCIEWLLANRGRRSVPHIHFEDGFGPDERPEAQNRKRVWMRRLAFRKPGLEFVAPSRVLADVFPRVWGVDPARVTLIPNGVDLTTYARIERPERPVTVGTVAALRPEKRLDRLISCIMAMRDTSVRLLIVGGGAERDALEAQARPLGERVTFAGEQGAVAPFLAEMDIYALTSDTEQMPISLVEAMASGLPVAATDVGDVASMVAEPNRPFVVPLGEELALVRALDDLAGDPRRRGALGEANHRRAVTHYGLDAMTARYDELFRRCAKPKLG